MTTLRPYQQACVGDALAFFDSVAEKDEAGIECVGRDRRRLYAAPTGSGKTRPQVAILRTLREGGVDAWVVTPSIDILRGFLVELGVALVDQPSGDEALFTLAEEYHLSTPTRLRNRCLDARLGVPDVWIVDEVHHAIEGNEVSGCNFALGPASVWLGFTATPYRGTPQGTAALVEAWGDPFLLLTYPEAVEAGFVVVPDVTIEPLLDDDLLKVSASGEFVEKAAGAAMVSRIELLAAIVAKYATPHVFRPSEARAAGSPYQALCDNEDARRGLGPITDVEGSVEQGLWFDVPTMVSVPSTDCVHALVEALDRLGVDSVGVTQNTSGPARLAAFSLCEQRRAALVQIKVVSEGVNLPWLGRLIDARPMVSPVAWLQQIGRVTRPGHGPKHYVCTNRNVERHAYLLQGALPRSTVAAAQAAFQTPSKRGAGRTVGLEVIGRLKPLELPLLGGVTSHAFSVWRMEGVNRVKYAVLHDPCSDEPQVYRCEDVVEPGKEVAWGRWVPSKLPASFEGFATSKKNGPASEKQLIQWQRHAKRLGLDPDVTPTARQCDFLFCLLQGRGSLVEETWPHLAETLNLAAGSSA